MSYIAGRVGLVPKGIWNESTEYKKLDIVAYDNKGYIAKVDNIPIGTLPTDENYFLCSFDLSGYANLDNPIFTGSFSLGRKEDTIVGLDSFACGYQVEASGSSSHAEGTLTTASGWQSHAEGNRTTASGWQSHAEGYSTTAEGTCAHAEGDSTTASGQYSHAEGYRTTVNGQYSHAEGYRTTANGWYSHAEGESTTANGNYSHASGVGSIASSDCQTVIGRWNIEDMKKEYAFIIGNGTDEQHRSNALAIKWDGTIVTSDF